MRLEGEERDDENWNTRDYNLYRRRWGGTDEKEEEELEVGR